MNKPNENLIDHFDYRRGFVCYPDATDGADGAKAPYVDNGTAIIDPKRYYTKEEANLEWERMWTRTWVWVGLEHDLKQVGDYFTAAVGSESFIIVRSAPERIQAFYNVCPHRGNRLVYEDFGSLAKGDTFRCNFHGWCFSANGKLREIRDEEVFRPEVLAGLEGLVEVKCDAWNSLVFINMDTEAKPLMDHLGMLPELTRKAPPFAHARIFKDSESIVDTNWKVGMDAFLEFYHGYDVHPQVKPIIHTRVNQYDLYPNGISRMLLRLGVSDREGYDEVVPEEVKGLVQFFGGNPDDYQHLAPHEYDKALADTLRKWAERNGHKDDFDRMTDQQVTGAWDYSVFPNLALNMLSWGNYLITWLPHPRDPEKHIMRAISLIMPVTDPQQYVLCPGEFIPAPEPGWNGAGPRPERRRITDRNEWAAVIAQDLMRLPTIHEGVCSRAFAGHRFGESDSRIRHYLAELDRYLGRTSDGSKAR